MRYVSGCSIAHRRGSFRPLGSWTVCGSMSRGTCCWLWVIWKLAPIDVLKMMKTFPLQTSRIWSKPVVFSKKIYVERVTSSVRPRDVQCVMRHANCVMELVSDTIYLNLEYKRLPRRDNFLKGKLYSWDETSCVQVRSSVISVRPGSVIDRSDTVDHAVRKEIKHSRIIAVRWYIHQYLYSSTFGNELGRLIISSISEDCSASAVASLHLSHSSPFWSFVWLLLAVSLVGLVIAAAYFFFRDDRTRDSIEWVELDLIRRNLLLQIRSSSSLQCSEWNGQSRFFWWFRIRWWNIENIDADIEYVLDRLDRMYALPFPFHSITRIRSSFSCGCSKLVAYFPPVPWSYSMSAN